MIVDIDYEQELQRVYDYVCLQGYITNDPKRAYALLVYALFGIRLQSLIAKEVYVDPNGRFKIVHLKKNYVCILKPKHAYTKQDINLYVRYDLYNLRKGLQGYHKHLQLPLRKGLMAYVFMRANKLQEMGLDVITLDKFIFSHNSTFLSKTTARYYINHASAYFDTMNKFIEFMRKESRVWDMVYQEVVRLNGLP